MRSDSSLSIQDPREWPEDPFLPLDVVILDWTEHHADELDESTAA
jgi:hypothetical protein